MGALEIIKLFIDLFVTNWIEEDEEEMKNIYDKYFDISCLKKLQDVI